MTANYGEKNSWNLQCPRCGKKFKREHAKKEWTGQIVCNNCWDPKHPYLDPLPIPIDSLPVPDARPRAHEVSVSNLVLAGSIWHQFYYTIEGIIHTEASFKWREWNERWDGNYNVDFTAENFPLI